VPRYTCLAGTRLAGIVSDKRRPNEAGDAANGFPCVEGCQRLNPIRSCSQPNAPVTLLGTLTGFLDLRILKRD
jgi:hypothetical protein